MAVITQATRLSIVISIIAGIEAAVTLTATTIHTSTDSISAAEVAGLSVVFSTEKALYLYTDSMTQATKQGDFTCIKDISCYNSVCITANEYSGYVWSVGSSSMANLGRYPLTLQKISSVLNMRVAIIPETSYFLVAAEGKFGLNRFTMDNYDTHSRVYIGGISSSDQVLELTALWFTPYSVITYYGKFKLSMVDISTNIHLFDVATSSEVNNVVYYSYDPSRYMIGYSSKTSYVLYNFMGHSKYAEYILDASATSATIRHVFMPSQSQYTFMVTQTLIMIVNHYKSDSGPLIYSNATTTGKYFIMNVKSANAYSFNSDGLGQKLELASSYYGDCHPNCHGCTKPLSHYYCSACNTNSQLSDSTVCTIPFIFSLGTVIDDNFNTTKFGSGYIYMLVAVGCLLVFWSISCCIYSRSLQTIHEQDQREKLETALKRQEDNEGEPLENKKEAEKKKENEGKTEKKDEKFPQEGDKKNEVDR